MKDIINFRQELENTYPYSLEFDQNIDLGIIWKWILKSYIDKDFKWHNRTFYFKTEKEKLFFMLKWQK